MIDEQNQKLIMGWLTRRKFKSKLSGHYTSTDRSLASDARKHAQNTSFLAKVSLPQAIILILIISGAYFGFIARNRFTTRADFVIRKASENLGLPSLSSGPISGMFGSSSQNSLEDARYLKTYLGSPQVLKDLQKQYDFDVAYKRKFPDIFAGLPPNSTMADRLKLFQKQVNVQLDELSGVLTIRTFGFSSDDAFKLNDFLLKSSDIFVNKLNQNIGEKQLSFALSELNRSREGLATAKQNLLSFQSNANVLDPKKEAELKGEAISQLEIKLAELKVEQFTLQQQFKSPDEPELLVINDQISELKRLISSERKQLVNSGNNGLNRKAADLIKLESEVLFATDLYKTALVASEKARVDTQRQQKFMAVLSSPLKADAPYNNWRFRGFFSVVGLAFVSFSLTKFIFGMQANHSE